jgi:ABC-type hemin transport system ATPase subunit
MMAAQAAVPSNARIYPFRKAVKRNAKLRLAVSGPGGSGKTYTLLTLATELGGRVALVDTEHGSASNLRRARTQLLLCQRVAAAFLAISLRCSGVSF